MIIYTVFANINGFLYEYNFSNVEVALACNRYFNLGENKAYILFNIVN